ncbi:MAG: hypothetical protein EHM47_08315 [Ignavibacteriales bacterium]|nr:MAG: hypothetical protein EHM47_08315 [Ignavibacteriales bacterium]
MIIKKNIYFILFISIVYFNCSDEPTSISGGIPPKNSIGLVTINSKDDSLSQRSSYNHPSDVKLSPAGRLLIGRINNEIDASILIKFQISLADSVKEDILNDSITVTSAVMEFRQVYSFGDENQDLDFTVHKALQNWSIDITEDSTVQIDPSDSKIDFEINDSITTVTLNNLLLQEWLDITADTSLDGNYGVHIQPAGSVTNKVLGYRAITSSFEDVPFIRVVIEKTGGVYKDTIIFSTTADLTLMKGSIPPTVNENILIRSGYFINAVLAFDLSTVPDGIVVNKAELVLTADTVETKIGSGGINSLQTYFLFDSTNTDSISSSSIRLSKFGDTYSGDVTNYVRAWLNGNNQGMLVTPTDPYNGVEIFVIKGSDALPSEKPLLRITYTKQN